MPREKGKGLHLVELKKPGCWIYDHPSGSVVVYGTKRGKELDVATCNFLLDMAKDGLLK